MGPDLAGKASCTNSGSAKESAIPESYPIAHLTGVLDKRSSEVNRGSDAKSPAPQPPQHSHPFPGIKGSPVDSEDVVAGAFEVPEVEVVELGTIVEVEAPDPDCP